MTDYIKEYHEALRFAYATEDPFERIKAVTEATSAFADKCIAADDLEALAPYMGTVPIGMTGKLFAALIRRTKPIKDRQ